ncbi:MAG: hydantoinase/oxoprolinase family protein [Alphaproteobacteria bacterium]
MAQSKLIGVDIGGTFTDVVCLDDQGQLRQLKLSTTRANPSLGVAAALEQMEAVWQVAPADIRRFLHGTTVATNAVLERQGATVGLLTTAGFRDVLEIGRQSRRAMYDIKLRPETPVFLAPRRLRKEVRERIGADGSVVTPLDESDVVAAVDELVAAGVEAVAVCYLFSFLAPRHEQRTAQIIAERHPGLMVSLSSDVDPTFREYERTSVTAFDAYIRPVVARYLADMEQQLSEAGVGAPLQVMQSRGGLASGAVARRRPVRLFLSGPAAGVAGGQMSGAAAGIGDLITVDIGGTSCDIALVDKGRNLIRQVGDIAGFPVRVPMVDVNAIGAGGGSIAWIDDGGGLRVGPRSAGAEPGPACYGRGGDQATVTDASVVLGYIDPGYFAGGTLALQPDLAHEAVRRQVAEPLGLSVEDAALGMHRVLNVQMAEGIRLATVSRGFDPRGFTLVPLGGGGGLHATALADELGIDRVLVPLLPGVLSAIGLLVAPVEHEATAAFGAALDELDPQGLVAALERLDATCAELMRTEQVDASAVEIGYAADICYIGQSYHLEVPFEPGDLAGLSSRLYDAFRAAHDTVYGYAAEAPATLVNLRSVHRAPGAADIAEIDYRPSGAAPVKGHRTVRRGDGPVEAAVYHRMALEPGADIAGPAILEQPDTTTLVPRGWSLQVAASGIVHLQREART